MTITTTTTMMICIYTFDPIKRNTLYSNLAAAEYSKTICYLQGLHMQSGSNCIQHKDIY